MPNKSTLCKSERQTQAGGNLVCRAGISWCGTAPCSSSLLTSPLKPEGLFPSKKLVETSAFIWSDVTKIYLFLSFAPAMSK